MTASGLALTLGVTALPALTLAAESVDAGSGHMQHQGQMQNGHARRHMGMVATLSSMTDNGDGTGTLTLTIVKVPKLPQGGQQSQTNADRPAMPKVGDSITVNYDQNTKFGLGGNREATVDDLTVGQTLRLMMGKPAEGSTTPTLKAVTDQLKPPTGKMPMPPAGENQSS